MSLPVRPPGSPWSLKQPMYLLGDAAMGEPADDPDEEPAEEPIAEPDEDPADEPEPEPVVEPPE